MTAAGCPWDVVVPGHCCACGGAPGCVCCRACGAECIGDCRCPYDGSPVLAAVTALARVLAGLAAARDRLALLRAEHAALLAAARATVAAAAAGDADPAAWVRGVLAEHGQLPEPGARPVAVVADARSAMCLTGWPS
jgi:hypothetical protein